MPLEVLVADDDPVSLDTTSLLVEDICDCVVVAKALSLADVEWALAWGVSPHVAIVGYSFPKEGDGQKAAQIIQAELPQAVIISYSGQEDLNFGTYNFLKGRDSAPELTAALVHLHSLLSSAEEPAETEKG
ncbi:MAG: hypothetical protein Q7S31_00350 [bacterium]|nr:hypothetical protein [bacterium]